jgi:hypothetical protein
MGLKATTDCMGYQQITSVSAATALTVPAGATLALVIPEAQNVRWRDDAVNPSASVGMPLLVGGALAYDGNLQNIRFIESVAGAILNVSYYR